MNIESLREHLAIKVRGWRKELQEKTTDYPCRKHIYIIQNDEDWLYCDHWNPPENIEQAMGLLNTVDEWRIDHHRRIYEVILPHQKHIGDGVDKFLPMAISLAFAKATEWKE